MKIGILYIALGKYDIFFDDFYKSCEQYFLPGHEKMYYVWTDSTKIPTGSNISKFEAKKEGWPWDTMLRFHKFTEKEEILTLNDYLFFFNANMQLQAPVGEEVFNDLIGALHPHFYNKSVYDFPYERNGISNFYIPRGQGQYYFQGCFNGGRADKFLEMSKELSEGINADLLMDHIPIWHDESALNWYFHNRNVGVLSPSYAYPESLNIPFEKIIVQRDKAKLGGHEFLRS